MAAFVFYTVVLCSFIAENPASTFLVDVNTTVKVAEVDTTFLSVALDAEEIAKDLKQVPFNSPKFIALCEGLSKINFNRPMLYLRVGGTKGDDIVFDWTGLDVSSEKYVMNSTEWDQINSFAMKMQWKFIFGLNSLERKSDGSWDPTNFIMLMRYTSAKGYLVNYELGNGKKYSSLYRTESAPAVVADTRQTWDNINCRNIYHLPICVMCNDVDNHGAPKFCLLYCAHLT